ncbi:hypothetical protein Tco_0633569 [Tanacetum coccineum]
MLVDNRPWLEDLVSKPAHLWQLMVIKTYTSLAIESKFMKRWEFDSIAQAAKGLMSWFPGTLYEALLLEHRLNYMIGKCEMKEENDIDAFVQLYKGLVEQNDRTLYVKETQFEYSKSHVMNGSKSANNEDNKLRPVISSKKLCLSNKIIQKQVPDSKNRLEDTAGDLDSQKVNMPDVKKKVNLQKDVPGLNKRFDDVFPRDLGVRMENLLEVQKETDIPEYVVGSKRLLRIGRKRSQDAS